MKQTFIILALLFAFSPRMHAQAPTSLEELQKKYQAMLIELDQPLTQWDERYQIELKKLQAHVQQAGDLDQVLVIQQQIDAIGQGGGNKVNPRYTNLARLQQTYTVKSKNLLRERGAKMQQGLRSYGAKLTALKTELTRAGDIEGAVAVNKEIDTIKMELQGIARNSQVRRSLASANRNQRPGKLLFYQWKDGQVSPSHTGHEETPVIAISSESGSWLAITTEGKAIGRTDVASSKNNKDVRQVACGHGVRVLVHHDDTATVFGLSDANTAKLKDIKNVRKASAGVNNGAILLKDGTVVPFGRVWSYGWPGPPEMLKGVSDLVVGAQLFIRRPNGEVRGVNHDGTPVAERPQGLEKKKIVDMVGTMCNGCIMLSDQGEIIVWSIGGQQGWSSMKIPEDAQPARAVRANRDYVAAQKSDGTWTIFTGTSWCVEKAKLLDEAVKKLGPLKDLELSHTGFLAIK